MRRWSSLVLAMALLAVACGSEDGAGPASTTTPADNLETTTAAPGSTAPTTIALVEVDTDDERSTTEAADPAITPSTTTPIAEPTTSTTPSGTAATLAPADAPTVDTLGPGRPNWFSTDHTAVIVATPGAADGPITCEGFARPALGRLPLDDTPPTVAVLGPNADALGQPTRPAAETISLLEGCGGEYDTLWVGSESPNGLMARIEPVPLSQLVSVVGDFTTTTDGSAFVGATVGGGDTEPAVIEIDARSGAVTELFPGEYLRVAALADGTYLGLTWFEEIRHLEANGTLVDSNAGTDFAVSPDHTSAAIFTADTLELGSPGADPTVVVTLPAAGSDQGQWDAVVLPGDDGVVFTRRSAIDQPIWWATAAGELVELLPADQWGDLVVSGDGMRLATSRPVADPTDPFAEEVVVISR